MNLDMQNKINDLIELVMTKGRRQLELKGTPMCMFESGHDSVWILEDGNVYVCRWDGEKWDHLDDSEALKVLKTAYFELNLLANYESLVRGKKNED
jgi:hypothetical protein